MLIRLVARLVFLVRRVLIGVAWSVVFGPDLFIGVMYPEAFVA